MKFSGWLATAVVLIVLVAAQVPGAEGGTEDAQFAQQIRFLDPANKKAERLGALQWLRKRCYRPQAVRAVSALERCLKQDPDAEVRTRAVETLAMVAYQQRRKVCPVAVLEALLDRDADVRNLAMGTSGMFKEFAPGSVAVLLRCAQVKDPDVRAHAVFYLAVAGGKDEKTLRVVRAARNDPDYRVRNDAHAGLFKVTGRLEDIVPYCLRARVELREANAAQRAKTKAGQRERERRNYLQLGILSRLDKLGEARPEELAQMVVGLLKDKTPLLRRSAATFVGDAARLGLLQGNSKGGAFPFLKAGPQVDISAYFSPESVHGQKGKTGGATKKVAPRESKLGKRLRELKVAGCLRKLRASDPDRLVREAAADALKALAALTRKQP